MQITVEVPEQIGETLRQRWGGDLPCRVLEAFAIEAYRSGELSSSEIRRLLGYQTPMELDRLLARAGIPREYSDQELDHMNKHGPHKPAVILMKPPKLGPAVLLINSN